MAVLSIPKNVKKRFNLGKEEWIELTFKPPDYWDRAKFGLRLASIVDLDKLNTLQNSDNVDKIPEDEFLKTIKDTDGTIDGIREQLETTVIDWNNVIDEEGNSVPYSFTGLTTLLSMYPKMLSEVAETLNTVLSPEGISPGK